MSAPLAGIGIERNNFLDEQKMIVHELQCPQVMPSRTDFEAGYTN